MSDNDVCGYEKADGDPCELPNCRDDGRCWMHTDEGQSNVGRPCELDDHEDEILRYARDGMSIKNCAEIAGVDESTLHRWLNNYDEFYKSFKRARAQGAHTLRRQLLKPREEENAQGARFLLERSHEYTKTEKKELEHSSDEDTDLGTTIVLDSEYVDDE